MSRCVVTVVCKYENLRYAPWRDVVQFLLFYSHKINKLQSVLLLFFSYLIASAPNILVMSLAWRRHGYILARLPHPPIILRGPSNRTVYEGETVSFECRILSDLQPHVQWLKHYMVNGSYVNDNGTAYVTALVVSRFTMLSVAFTFCVLWFYLFHECSSLPCCTAHSWYLPSEIS